MNANDSAARGIGRKVKLRCGTTVDMVLKTRHGYAEILSMAYEAEGDCIVLKLKFSCDKPDCSEGPA